MFPVIFDVCGRSAVVDTVLIKKKHADVKVQILFQVKETSSWIVSSSEFNSI